jgi:hypothetical protein
MPRLALATDHAVAKCVASFGPVDRSLGTALAAEGVTIDAVEEIGALVHALMRKTFDAVLIRYEAKRAVELAHGLKLDEAIDGVDGIERRMAARRHRRKPLFILPLPGDDEYGVVVIAQELAYLERTHRCPLPRAIAFFDAAKLLASGSTNLDPGVA